MSHLEAQLMQLHEQLVATALHVPRSLFHLEQLDVEVAESFLVKLLHACHAVAL
jgi:hypothetical protein